MYRFVSFVLLDCSLEACLDVDCPDGWMYGWHDVVKVLECLSVKKDYGKVDLTIIVVPVKVDLMYSFMVASMETL